MDLLIYYIKKNNNVVFHLSDATRFMLILNSYVLV